MKNDFGVRRVAPGIAPATGLQDLAKSTEENYNMPGVESEVTFSP